MPDLFPDVITFVLCGFVVAGAHLIYATVGFGAGMFSIALLALLLPELAETVATLLLLTFMTEVWVLVHAWREAKVRLLLGLLPTAAVGMWLGTELLVAGNVAWLKRVLGVVIVAAGVWFLYEERRRRTSSKQEPKCGVNNLLHGVKPVSPAFFSAGRKRFLTPFLTGLPAGLASGTLAGLFGTGGPPVIIFLRAHGLDKGAFRATLLWFFLLMSFLRTTGYLRAGILTGSEVTAALWLLPAALAGTRLGMVLHRRMSQRGFQMAVSILLILLGGLLALGGGR